jgi:hypothetical protein
MKSILPILILATAAPVFAGEMRDAATNQQLTERLRSQRANDPVAAMQVVEGEDPTANRPEDLVATSEFLSFDGISTLVPKGALLCVPSGLADRARFRPGYRIVSWAEFHSRNLGWISTAEVTLYQSTGREPLSEAFRLQIGQGGTLIVATMKEGPISVNPYRPDAAGDTAAR